MKVNSRGLNLLYQVDTFAGDGTTVAFTLSQIPYDTSDPMAFIDGLFQSPANYSISGTTITFASAPTASTDILVRYLRKN